MKRHSWHHFAEHRYVCRRCGTGKVNERRSDGWVVVFYRPDAAGTRVERDTPPCEPGPRTDRYLAAKGLMREETRGSLPFGEVVWRGWSDLPAGADDLSPQQIAADMLALDANIEPAIDANGSLPWPTAEFAVDPNGRVVMVRVRESAEVTS